MTTIAECASPEPYSTQIGPFGEKIRASIYTAVGAPVLRGTNVNTNSRFHDDDFVFIDSSLAETEFSKFVCEAGDIILCHKGTIGKIGLIPKENRFGKYIMGNSMMKVRCNRSKLEPLYLYYWLSSRAGQDYLFSRVSQVGVPQIQRPLTTLREAEFPLPSLPEQKAIVTVLGALDDKIELNQRMNMTLESMARALFQSWFVEFEPVRAKAEGRLPAGLDESTAALFPSRFQDSNLGDIPSTWRYTEAQDLARIGIGKTPPRKEPQWFSKNLSDVPWVSIRDMGTSGTFIQRTSEFLTEEAVSRFNVRRVPKGTVLVSFKLTIGRVVLADMPLTTNEAIAHFNLLPENGLTREFLYLYLSQFNYGSLGSTSSIATAVNSDTIRQMPILAPPKNIVTAFTDLVSPLFEKIRTNQSESHALRGIRDALSPKLLGGEIELPTLET